MVEIFCDIDGVLVDYPSDEFLTFLAERHDNIQKKMDISEIKKALSTSEYKEAKLKFRQSGIKQHLKPITEAVNALNHISSLGVKINIITSRPHIHSNCRNTLNWLQNISLNFHHLYFCRRKETLIFYPKKDEYFIIIDDNEDFLIQYAEIENTKTLLMSKSLDSRTKFWKNLEDLVIAKLAS